MTPRPIDLCVHCGEPEGEHHEFKAVKRPAGCTCDPTDWADDTPSAVCGQYIAQPDGGGGENCATCEHYETCHGETTDE